MTLRVEPAGVHAAAALLDSSAAALSAAVPQVVVAPAGGDDVSVAAAALINSRAAHVASAVRAAAAVMVGAAAVLRSSAADYVGADVGNSGAIAGSGRGYEAGAVAVAPVPDLMSDRRGVGVPLQVGADPMGLAAALLAGDLGTSAATHSQAWAGLAGVLAAVAGDVGAVAAAGLPGSWNSPAADRAIGRLGVLGGWLTDAGRHARVVSESSAAHARDHGVAVAAHPSVGSVGAVRSALATNQALVAAGDTAAVPALAVSRQQWARLVSDSSAVVAEYGGASAQSTAPQPQVPPPPAVAAGNDGAGGEKRPAGEEPAAAGEDRAGDEDAPAGDDGVELTADDPGVQADAMALAARELAAQGGAQQDSQQAAQMMAMGSQMLQQALAPLSSLASSAIAPVSMLGADAGIDPGLVDGEFDDVTDPGFGDYAGGGGGGGDYAGGGGAGGGGFGGAGSYSGVGVDSGAVTGAGASGTAAAGATSGAVMPKTAPTRIAGTTIPGVVSEPAAARPAMPGGAMPMSPAMMGGLGAPGGGGARPRNKTFSPDEPVYVDQTPHSPAVIGARQRTPPKATPPAEKSTPTARNAKGTNR
ncbi:PE domain-containing protein [Aldersonia sp. NBC_00410]|uniref:PE domain-containing protein n=1 Tax=Aldersonia sp. NBC_00410 TaxID=2975954 RepID=UPI002252EE1C|nr:PE domain-containing protein [Aldersonia sp. NBC_00410]MCX5046283.1 PE domain-containing protein [Aldersonia sp. NBC_00410]